MICHCGDAGWISGQALNGLIAASLHGAPMALVMHRNGIQLSGTTARVMDKDPRPIVKSLGIEVIEIASLHERRELFGAYRAGVCARARRQAVADLSGRIRRRPPCATSPTRYGIVTEAEHFCEKHKVAIDTPVRIPGSLMSYRDPHAMLECLFYVNELPGGEAHHDGGMKGRDHAAALANPDAAADAPTNRRRSIACGSSRSGWSSTSARPQTGIAEPRAVVGRSSPAIALPGTDKWVTARAGSEAAYVAVAKKYRVAVLLRVVRSQSLDEARQGRGARAARPRVRDEHPGAGRDADDRRPVVRRRSPAAQRVRDLRRVHGRHCARGLRVLALPAQPERLERRPQRR